MGKPMHYGGPLIELQNVFICQFPFLGLGLC